MTYRLVNKKLREGKQFGQSFNKGTLVRPVAKVTIVTKLYLFSNHGGSGNKGKCGNKENISNQTVINVSRYSCKVSVIFVRS